MTSRNRLIQKAIELIYMAFGNIDISSNHANNQGGGMYLVGIPAASTTNFNGVTVSGNVALDFTNSLPGGGAGVYQQNRAIVTPNPPGPPNAALKDNDDPNGNPLQGP